MRATGRDVVAVFTGGLLGALARAGLLEALGATPGSWPWATFAANVAGALLLGAVVARRWHSGFLGTGFCGALTTFSAFQLELLQMLDAGEVAPAAGYAAASLGAGLLALHAGRRLA